MPPKFRVGLCSIVHDHIWGELHHWMAHPEVQIVAVGEANPRLREKALAAGVPKTYDSWPELLDRETLDIVLAYADNKTGSDVTEAAMAKGAHVVSEKPMAATLGQATRMMNAAKTNDRLLMINWPHVWDPAYQEWERRARSGDIGRIIHLKRRNAHNGPKEIGCDPAFVEWLYDADRNGAGALMDYCCYGADIAAYLLGLPKKVTGIRGVLAKDYAVPDDNAIILMQYEHAFAQAEASWTEIAGPPGPYMTAYGTEGSCAIVNGKVALHRPGKEIEELEPQPLRYPKRNAPDYFIHCLKSGEPIEGCCSADASYNAQVILDAGLRSADTGRHIELSS